MPTGVCLRRGNSFFSYERRLKAEILEPQSDMELSNFLRLTNRSIVASPNERNGVGLGEGEEENLLNSKFVDQQQIFFHCTGGKINRKGREWKRYFAGHASQY